MLVLNYSGLFVFLENEHANLYHENKELFAVIACRKMLGTHIGTELDKKFYEDLLMSEKVQKR